MSPARRRQALIGLGGLAIGLRSLPAQATPQAMQALIEGFTRGRAPQARGITLSVPEIVENGNTVPVSVRVESAMSGADRVRRVAVFSERNPAPDVLVGHFGPAAALAQLSFRMRMADSQALVALAEMADGEVRIARVAVVVALAACLE
ncbi:MAG: sulfur oxidation protein SoxY [Betaproteobacteria bacterium]|nr:sulfur oxidation protein SoxY [Betaproteobacteria bacterium]